MTYTVAAAITSFKNTEGMHVPFYSSQTVFHMVAFSFLFMFFLLLGVNIALVG